jgi:hypothetical protein
MYATATGYGENVELHYDSKTNKSFLFGDNILKTFITEQSVEPQDWPPDYNESVMLPPDKVFAQFVLSELVGMIQVTWLKPHPALVRVDNEVV